MSVVEIVPGASSRRPFDPPRCTRKHVAFDGPCEDVTGDEGERIHIPCGNCGPYCDGDCFCTLGDENRDENR